MSMKQNDGLPSPESFAALVESRRAVRRFTEEPVPDAVVRACLELALLSPNASNLQPWSFVRVRSPEKRARLAEACLSQNAAKTAPELIVVVARTDTWREHCRLLLERWPDEEMPGIVRNYYGRVAPFFYSQGPLGVWGLLKRIGFTIRGLWTPSPREPFSPAALRTWAVKSTALAAQTLMLAFHAHGYDTCPMEGFDRVRLKRIVGLPRQAHPIMVVAVGRRGEKGIYNTRYRFPYDEVVSEI